MLKLTLLSLLIMFSFSAYSSESCDTKISKEQAEVIATELLKSETWANEFNIPADEISSQDCEWLVWFKLKDWETIRPNRKIVSVNKTTGITKWLPVK